MSAALLRIAKLIPRLGGASSESESLTALKLIEKALLSEGLTFTDAGMQLAEFVKTVMEVEDDPEIPAPPPPTNGAAPQWNTTGPGRSHAHANPGAGATGPIPGWNRAPPPPRSHTSNPGPGPSAARPAPPPPRPPLKWSATPGLTDSDYESRIQLILTHTYRHLIRTNKERKFLEDMYFSFTSGFGGLKKLTFKQLDFLHNILDRL